MRRAVAFLFHHAPRVSPFRAEYAPRTAFLYKAGYQTPAQSLLGSKIPAAIGAASNLLCIHVCAVDELGEALFFEAQAVLDVGNHLFEHAPATAERSLYV